MKSRLFSVAILLTGILVSRAANPLDTWVEIDRPQNTGALKAVEFGNGLFVAGGVGGAIITSPDGANWTPQNSGVTGTIQRIKLVNGHLFADVESRNNLAIRSADGINWQPIPAGPRLYDITYGNGAYYAVYLNTNQDLDFEKSADLQTWIDLPFPRPATDVAFAGGIFFLGGGPWSYSSPDAMNWTESSYSTSDMGSISVQNGMFIVSGKTIVDVPSPWYPYHFTTFLWTAMHSTDGRVWNLSLTENNGGRVLSKVIVGGTNYVAASAPRGLVPGAPPSVIYYTDSLTNTWTQVTPNFTPEADGSPDIAFGNTRFVAVIAGKILRSSPVSGAFAPEIFKHPSSFAATIGGTATFTVVVQGTEPLSYQWRKGGAELNGATSGTLTLTNVTFDSAGDYDVVVSNSAGSKTSTKAILSINFAQVHRYSGVTLNGAIGDKFLIEYQDELDPTGAWHTSTTVTLATTSSIWIDYSSAETEHRFYRAIYQGR
jgi:hypothetical protein